MPHKMIDKLGLKSRFFMAMLLVVLLLVVTFYLAVSRGVNAVEGEMIQGLLVETMNEYAQTYEQMPGVPPPSHGVLTGFVVKPGQESPLPKEILALGPGLHDDVAVGESEFLVGRQDVRDVRIYFLLDIKPIENFERDMMTIAWVSIALGLILASLATLLLAKFVAQPVTRLADQLSRLDPRQRRIRLSFADREAGLIAEAFNRYAERLDEFVEREQAFTDDVSHELRTPLTVIISGAKLLEEDSSLSDPARQKLARVTRAAGRMQEMLEALLFLAREEAGSPASACSIDEVLRDVVADFRGAAQDKQVQLNFDAEPTVASVPPALAISVMSNILGNALHHTRQGQISIQLKNRILTVEDSGTGISAEELPRIFERRYRGSGSKGMGLGLYIVKRICERLQWGIEVDSKPGAGTRFVLRLPAG